MQHLTSLARPPLPPHPLQSIIGCDLILPTLRIEYFPLVLPDCRNDELRDLDDTTLGAGRIILFHRQGRGRQQHKGCVPNDACTHSEKARGTDRQTNRQTDRQTGQTDRQTEWTYGLFLWIFSSCCAAIPMDFLFLCNYSYGHMAYSYGPFPVPVPLLLWISFFLCYYSYRSIAYSYDGLFL